MTNELIEKLVSEWGENHRIVIRDMLDWLAEIEPTWNLEHPIDKEKFVRSVLVKANE